MSKLKIETGSSPAEERFSITVTEKGPFLVYGRPPLAEQFIMPNEQNESWYFQEGRRFSTEAEPTALCRCGASKRKPYAHRAVRRSRSTPAGHPRSVDVPRRTADGLGPKNGQPLRIPVRPESRADRGRHHRQQRRPVDSRRHSPAARRRPYLRNPQPRGRMPLRPVGQQTLLRRHARLDPVQRPARRAAAPIQQSAISR